MEKNTKLIVVGALFCAFAMIVSSALAGYYYYSTQQASSTDTALDAAASSAAAVALAAATATTTAAAATTAAATTPAATFTPGPATVAPAVISANNDTLTNEDVVYRPSWNHNMLTLPTGNNKAVGRCFFLNHTGGGDVQTTDGTQIYVPVTDDSYNNKAATGVAGTSYHINNNINFMVVYDGSRWVIL